VDFVYTRHQTPRGSRPDAEVGNMLYLIKNVTEMRLTYQIKMLTYFAHSKGKKLVVQLPKQATIHASLREFAKNSSGVVKIERAS
jgi:hypothetical protein